MDYEAAQAVFYEPAPEGAPIPAPVQEGGPARRLRDACEPIAMHAVWSRLVNERLAARGLNFLTAYVWGRAAPMGEPAAPLVAAAFAAFEPGLIVGLYEEGRAKVGRAELLRIQEQATVDSLRRILGDIDVRDVVAALRRGIEGADGTGRPLFASVRSLGWPGQPLGQLWRACHAVREHRGDSHIAAYISAGFDPVEMNILTELYVGWPLGTYSATRAWSDEHTRRALGQLRSQGLVMDGALTAKGHQVRHAIEERTDAMEQALVGGIVDAVGDLDAVLEPLNRWAAGCIEAGAFPPNPLKRAAG